MPPTQNVQIALSLLQTVGLLLPIVIIMAQLVLNNFSADDNGRGATSSAPFGGKISASQTISRLITGLLVVMGFLALTGITAVGFLLSQTSSKVLVASLVLLSLSLLAFLPVVWYVKKEQEITIEVV